MASDCASQPADPSAAVSAAGPTPDSVPLLPPPPPDTPGSTREPLSKKLSRTLLHVLDHTSNGTRVATTTLNLRVALAPLPPAPSSATTTTTAAAASNDHMRLVFLSDIHFNGAHGGPATSGGTFACAPGELVQSAVDAVNAADADVVVLGGDLVDGDGAQYAHELVSRYLSQLRARCGVWAVLGNHDQFVPGSRHALVHALQDAGIAVLDNASVQPLPCLEIVGVGDITTPGDFRPVDAFPCRACTLPPSSVCSHRVPACSKGVCSPQTAVGGLAGSGSLLPHCRVVVTHNPDAAPHLMGYPAHIQLSGHTHGGQICLPTAAQRPLAAWLYEDCGWCCCGATRSRIWPVYRSFSHWEWANGLHTLSQPGLSSECARFLYVTRGIGSHTPGRLFCPPEVVIVNIEVVRETDTSVV